MASAAFNRFGRASGNPARLNFGDCMAYAVSAVMRAPLLFKGGDFGHTDVMAHPAVDPVVTASDRLRCSVVRRSQNVMSRGYSPALGVDAFAADRVGGERFRIG